MNLESISVSIRVVRNVFKKNIVIIFFVDTGAPPEPQAPKHVIGQPVMPKFDPSQALAKLRKPANVRFSYTSPSPEVPLQLLRFSLDFCSKARYGMPVMILCMA